MWHSQLDWIVMVWLALQVAIELNQIRGLFCRDNFFLNRTKLYMSSAMITDSDLLKTRSFVPYDTI